VGPDQIQNPNPKLHGGNRHREESKAMKRMLWIPILAVVSLALAFGQEAAEKKSPGPAKAAGGGVGKEIRDLENQWNDAMLKHDADVMDRILADDVVDIGSSGQVSTKAEDLADLKSGEPKLESSSVDHMKVRVFGIVAVVNGHYAQKGTYKGKDISGEGHFTDVFVKRDGRWQCVSTEGTPLTKQ
jgi:ketosteroid isomerase-like protein